MRRLLDEIGVSRETEDRLRLYADLLHHWTRRINLISSSTTGEIFSRHIEDSAQLWPLLPTGSATWIDLGTGGGLPGAVIAAIAAEKAPDLLVSLVESDARKVAFLRKVRAELGLRFQVFHQRIETLGVPPQDVVSARALAPMTALIELARPFCHEATVLLFPKGSRVDSELTEACRHWHIELERVPSRIEQGGVILRITSVGPIE